MSANSKIEWTDHTFNPWIGCTKVSPGCAHCYAETLMDTRYGKVKWGKGQPRQRTSAANWKLPRRWNRLAEIQSNSWNHQKRKLCCDDSELTKRGFIKPRRPRVFCASLADWLDDAVPIDWLADLLALIHATPNLDWLLLSKRLENWDSRTMEALKYAARKAEPKMARLANWIADWRGTLHCEVPGEHPMPPANIWIGTTVENQAMADKRIPELLRIPAKVRFLSCEPLLGPVDLGLGKSPHVPGWWQGDLNPVSRLSWVICGGESGPGARPMHPDWARSLRDQCAAAGVPFFIKQMGGTRKPFAPIPDDLNIRQFPTP